MRAVIQRVKEASVTVDGKVVGAIGKGLLVLFGVHRGDALEETRWLAKKIVGLRIFSDEKGKMNRSVEEVGGEVLVVSQFTLYGNCVSGRRPDFIEAAAGEEAKKIYMKLACEIKEELGKVETGIFGAAMEVALVNDGPVTLLVEGKKSVKMNGIESREGED